MFTRLILLAASSLTLLNAADDPWRFLDPTSRMVMGVQWRRIQDSPAAAKFRQEMRDKMPFPALPGMDFLSGIDSALIASTGVAAGKNAAQTPTLIVLSGQFDLSRIRASVHKRSRRAVVQNVEIFESAEKGPGKLGIALYSSDILLLGDTPSLVRAVGGHSGQDSLLLARARRMNEDNDFWIVSSVPPTQVGAENLPIPLPLEDIRALEMGIAISDGMGMELSMQMGSADAARKAKSDFEKTVRLAGKEKHRPDLAGLDKHMSLTIDGDFLRLAFKIDSAQLERRMRAYQPRSAAPTVAATPTVPMQPRPTNGKPVIWNADK